MFKIKNNSKALITLATGHPIQAGKSIEVDEATHARARNTPNLKAHFLKGRLTSAEVKKASGPNV